MRFELTDALCDDIVFSMECQYGDFYVDSKEGRVIDAENPIEGDDEALNDEDESRLYELPGWDSADGFALMSHFCSGVRGKEQQKALEKALHSGKGAFRAFKDTVSHYPELEKLWYQYKENEMRKVVQEWYEGLCDEWGVAHVTKPSDKVDETRSLVAEDFSLKDAEKADMDEAVRLHQRCLEEHEHAEGSLSAGDYLYGNVSLSWDAPGSVKICARTADGTFAGAALASPRGRAMHISVLEIAPEFRGMGVGEVLFGKLLEKIKASGDAHGITEPVLSLDLPAEWEGFSSALVKAGFKPATTRWVKI
jgi:GNAT superfamily N-acetyltransferase